MRYAKSWSIKLWVEFGMGLLAEWVCQRLRRMNTGERLFSLVKVVFLLLFEFESPEPVTLGRYVGSRIDLSVAPTGHLICGCTFVPNVRT